MSLSYLQAFLQIFQIFLLIIILIFFGKNLNIF